jgi:hypothetical protein
MAPLQSDDPTQGRTGHSEVCERAVGPCCSQQLAARVPHNGVLIFRRNHQVAWVPLCQVLQPLDGEAAQVGDGPEGGIVELQLLQL